MYLLHGRTIYEKCCETVYARLYERHYKMTYHRLCEELIAPATSQSLAPETNDE